VWSLTPPSRPQPKNLASALQTQLSRARIAGSSGDKRRHPSVAEVLFLPDREKFRQAISACNSPSWPKQDEEHSQAHSSILCAWFLAV
jgi:hypothetical protein